MADFQKRLPELRDDQIGLVAGSVDPEKKARSIIERLELTFPVAFDLDCLALAKALGCYYEPEKQFFHATGFLLRPDSRLEVACYSSGAIGRLQAGNVLSLVRYYKEHRD